MFIKHNLCVFPCFVYFRTHIGTLPRMHGLLTAMFVVKPYRASPHMACPVKCANAKFTKDVRLKRLRIASGPLWQLSDGTS